MNPQAQALYQWARDAENHLLGPEQGAWLDHWEHKREDLTSLLDELVAIQDSEQALLLAGALSGFWWMRGYSSEGLRHLEQVLALPGGSDQARACALAGAGSLAYAVGAFRKARSFYQQAVPLLSPPGPTMQLAQVLDRAGMAARQLMELFEARVFHTQALAIQRAEGSLAGQALCLNNLGVVDFFQDNLESAKALHLQALALREQAGDERGKASSLNNLGQIALVEGKLEAARLYLEQGLAIRKQLADRWGMAGSQVHLAVLCARSGEPKVAQSYMREATFGFREVNDPLGLCECLEAGSELAQLSGSARQSVVLLAAASYRREQIAAPRSPLHEKLAKERLAELQTALGDTDYASAWREGELAGESVEALLVGYLLT
jgi:tetratricopeptide (TPR) repeat protein